MWKNGNGKIARVIFNISSKAFLNSSGGSLRCACDFYYRRWDTDVHKLRITIIIIIIMYIGCIIWM